MIRKHECPTCGRSLRVRVEYLGAVVACKHCGAEFQACEAQGACRLVGDIARPTDFDRTDDVTVGGRPIGVTKLIGKLMGGNVFVDARENAEAHIADWYAEGTRL